MNHSRICLSIETVKDRLNFQLNQLVIQVFVGRLSLKSKTEDKHYQKLSTNYKNNNDIDRISNSLLRIFLYINIHIQETIDFISAWNFNIKISKWIKEIPSSDSISTSRVARFINKEICNWSVCCNEKRKFTYNMQCYLDTLWIESARDVMAKSYHMENFSLF